MTSRSTTPRDRRRKLLEDCLIMMISLVLSDPMIQEGQRKRFPSLIRRLKAEVK